MSKADGRRIGAGRRRRGEFFFSYVLWGTGARTAHARIAVAHLCRSCRRWLRIIPEPASPVNRPPGLGEMGSCYAMLACSFVRTTPGSRASNLRFIQAASGTRALPGPWSFNAAPSMDTSRQTVLNCSPSFLGRGPCKMHDPAEVTSAKLPSLHFPRYDGAK
jgi:hypothetical protein